MNQEIRNRRRLPMDLCGPYVCDEADSRAGALLPANRPRERGGGHSRRSPQQASLGGQGGIVLHLPGERVVSVEAAPMLSGAIRKRPIVGPPKWKTSIGSSSRRRH